jgi:hypothetical protein
MEIKKLKAIPYGQCCVEKINDNTFYLWSYRTMVAKVENNWLTINGLYSQTTRRHIGAFMREYCKSDYEMAKKLYTDKMMLNIDTGEVDDIVD